MAVASESTRMMIEKMRPYYPRFSPGEYARRYEAVRRAMEREGLAGLIVYGARGIGHGSNVKYLSNYADYRNSYILFPLEGPPTLFMGLFCHEFNARAISVIEDVRWSGNDIVVSAMTRAKELGFAVSLYREAENGHLACDQCQGLEEPFCVKYCNVLMRDELKTLLNNYSK